MKNVLAVIGAGGMGEAVVRRLGSGRRVLVADRDVELQPLARERREHARARDDQVGRLVAAGDRDKRGQIP